MATLRIGKMEQILTSTTAIIHVSHSSVEPLHIPLFFDGPINTTFNITGGAPLFRSEAKEPTGIPIQVSKTGI